MSIIDFIVSGLIFFIIDAIYLSTFGKKFAIMVKMIQGEKIKMNYSKYISAVICYILLIFSLNYYVLSEEKSLLNAFLLGVIIYGVFDSTNYVIFNEYNATIGLIDSLWGGILFTITTFIFYKIKKLNLF